MLEWLFDFLETNIEIVSSLWEFAMFLFVTLPCIIPAVVVIVMIAAVVRRVKG